jgi:hypothetical protein
MLNPARLLRMLIALTLVAGCGGNDTATTEASPTSAELTAATTERWVAAVKAEDPDQISSLYSEDAVWFDTADDSSPFNGRSGVYYGWDIFGYISEILAVEPVAVADEVAVARWTFAGERLGSGEPWELSGVSVLEMSDGVIARETVYYDGAHGP